MKRILLILTLIVTVAFQANAQSYVKPELKTKELMKWTKLSDMDTALYGATAFDMDGVPWVTLGDTASVQYSKPKHRKSTLVPNAGITDWSNQHNVDFVGRKRIGAFSFKLSNKIYIGGGRFVGDSAMIDSVYGGRIFDSTLMDVWLFNPSTNVWTQRADIVNRHALLPAYNSPPQNPPNTVSTTYDTLGRAYGVAFVMNGTAYVGHGYSKRYIPYDSTAWKMAVYPTTFPTVNPALYPSIPLPPHVFKVGKNVLDPKFSETRLYSDVFSYDTLSNKWSFITFNSTLNTAPSARGRYGCVAFVTGTGANSTAYIGLGSDSAGTYNEFFAFRKISPTNYSLNKVSQATFPYTPRNYANAVGIGDYGYVACGFDGAPQNDLYEFSVETQSWDRYADFIDTGRYQVADVLIGSKWYFFGGREASDETSKEVYLLKLDTNKVRITKVFDADSIFCTKDTIRVAYKGYYEAFSGSFLPTNYMVLEAVYFDNVTLTYNTIKLDSIKTDKFIDTLKFVYRPSITDREYFLSIRATHPGIPGVISKGKFRLQQGPDIQTEPQTVVVDIHKKANFRVEAVGTNITYQWYKDGGIAVKNDSFKYSDTSVFIDQFGQDSVVVSDKYFFHVKGAKDSLLTFDSVRVADSGTYYLVVSGTCSPPDTSIKVKLNVINTPTPKIIKQPADTIVCENTAAQIQVDVASITANYIWVKIDTIIKPFNNTFDTTIVRDTIKNGGNYNGANTNVLRFNFARAIDTGYYYVYIYESSGADTLSRFAKFSIEKAATILIQPELYQKKSELENTSFWIKAQGAGLTYQWYKDNVALSNGGGKYKGVDTDSLEINNISLKEAGFYYCIITTKCGNSAQTGYGLLEVDPFPVITAHPKDTSSACQGDTLSLSVQASGANLFYQWYRDGVKIDASTSPSGTYFDYNTRILTIAPLSSNHDGNYFCRVYSDSLHYVDSKISKVISKKIPSQPVIVQIQSCKYVKLNDDPNIICNKREVRWYFDGVFDGGQKDNLIYSVGKRAGQIQALVICDGCFSVKSDVVFCNTLGIDNIDKTGNLKLYPNPVHNGDITIEIPENLSGNISLNVYDISGRLIWNGKAEGADKYAHIDMSTLAAGMYQVQLINNDKIFVSKVIVE